MSIIGAISVILGFAALIYLFVALIHPERF